MTSPFNVMAPIGLWPQPGTGGGGSGTDRFAPRIIVGNEPAGDPATAQAAPFQYISDPGDGSGIEAALAALAAEPGWLHIRRGEYDLSTGAVADLQVPDGVYITGDGSTATIIRGRTAGNQRVFNFDGAGCLWRIGIDVPAGDVGATGAEVIRVTGVVDIQEVSVAFDGSADTALRVALSVAAGGSATVRAWRSTTTSTAGAPGVGTPFAHMFATGGVPGETPRGVIRGEDIVVSGGDSLIRAAGTVELTHVEGTGARRSAVEIPESPIDTVLRLVDCTFTGSAAAYAGATGLSALSAYSSDIGVSDPVVSLRSCVFRAGTAVASGTGMVWGFSGEPTDVFVGPDLVDVAFIGYAIGASFGDNPVVRASITRLQLRGCTNVGLQIVNGESADFSIRDLRVTLAPTSSGQGMVINGFDHDFDSVDIEIVSPDPVGQTNDGILLGPNGGARIKIAHATVRVDGDGNSRALRVLLEQCVVSDSYFEATASIGVSSVCIWGAAAGICANVTAVAFAGDVTTAIELGAGAAGIIVASCQTTTDATTPGIVIDADNCIVTGNVCHGLPVPAVQDNGANNEVFHNLSIA